MKKLEHDFCERTSSGDAGRPGPTVYLSFEGYWKDVAPSTAQRTNAGPYRRVNRYRPRQQVARIQVTRFAAPVKFLQLEAEFPRSLENPIFRLSAIQSHLQGGSPPSSKGRKSPNPRHVPGSVVQKKSKVV